ncbi:MAG: HECT domain-containing protein [Parachlamydia sp.]|jgi:hypothetical protein|nr:HECT domain-containing protein [Parachlamydia sp.]
MLVLNYLDIAARVIIDPAHPNFSPIKQKAAWALTFILGIASLGIIQAVSALWRKLRVVEEVNATHLLITQLFISQFQAPARSPEFVNPQLPQAPNVIPDMIPEAPLLQQLAAQELLNMKAAMTRSLNQGHDLRNPIEIQFNGQAYYCWYHQRFDAINIQSVEKWNLRQQEGKLGVIIDAEGQITSVRLNNQPYAEMKIPDEFNPLCQHIYNEVMRRFQPAEPGQTLVRDMNFVPPLVDTVQPEAVEDVHFSPQDLLIFRAALQKAAKRGHGAAQPISLEYKGVTYCLWYNREAGAINIQQVDCWRAATQDKKIGIVINEEGGIVSLHLNGCLLPCTTLQLPAAQHDLFQACFTKSLMLSSHYRLEGNHPPIAKITIIRRGLQCLPHYHLTEFCKLLSSAQHPLVSVNFLRDDLSVGHGIDRGGLTRDFIDDLAGALVADKALFQNHYPALLALPKAKDDSLSVEEERIFTSFGQLIMYCYYSKSVPGFCDGAYALGKHLDDSLFKVVLSLSHEEIITPYSALKLETKCKMALSLLEARRRAGDDNPCDAARFEWLLRFDVLSSEELKEAAYNVMYSGMLPEEWTVDGEGDHPIMNQVLADLEKFKGFLLQAAFEYGTSIGPLGPIIAPIHAIANGMMHVCQSSMPFDRMDAKWREIAAVDYQVFNIKVQGSIDRQEFADRFELYAGYDELIQVELQKKINWLKEWLVHEASEEEIRTILKFLCGSSSLIKDKKFSVVRQGGPYLPVPIAHTCSFTIELSPDPSSYGNEYNDYTKENFIKSLKDIALVNPSAYSMA